MYTGCPVDQTTTVRLVMCACRSFPAIRVIGYVLANRVTPIGIAKVDVTVTRSTVMVIQPSTGLLRVFVV